MPTFHEIIASIANGHAFDKHVRGIDPDTGRVDIGRQEFNTANAGKYGQPITPQVQSQQDLANLIQDVLDDPKTKAAYNVDTNMGVIYNADKNILIRLNASSNLEDAGSVYRLTGNRNIKYRDAVKDLGAVDGAVIEARNPDDVKSMVQRFADTSPSHFPRNGVVDRQIASTNVQNTANTLTTRSPAPNANAIQSFDDHILNRQNRPNTLKAEVNRAIDNGASLTTDGNKTTITPADPSVERTYEIDVGKNGKADITVRDPLTGQTEVFEGMTKRQTTSLLNSSTDTFHKSVYQAVVDASNSKGVDIAALGDDAKTVSIIPDNGNEFYELTKNKDGSMTVQVKGMDDVPIGDPIDLPKGYSKQLNSHFKTPSFMGRFDDLKRFTAVVVLAAGLGLGNPPPANAQTLDSPKPAITMLDEAPANLTGDMKSTLTGNMGDMTVEMNSSGHIIFDAHDPAAKDYGIQIAPGGESATVHIRNADGTIEVAQLDQDRLRNINDMLKGEEFSKMNLPGLDELVPPLTDIEGRPINPEIRIDGGIDGRITIPNADIPADVPKVNGNSADLIRQTDAAAELVESMRVANAATDAMKVGKAGGRMAKLSWVGGVALTGGVAALIHYAHSSQRDLATKLHESGELSDEAFEEYITLNRGVETEMQTENAAGQGWFFLITTPAVEASARAQFNEFSAKHNLSPELHKALGMSLFDGDSLAGKFAQEAIDVVPDKMSEMDPEFHDLWRATRELKDIQREHYLAHQPLLESRREGIVYSDEYKAQRLVRQEETSEALQIAKFEQQKEFARLLSDPKTGNELLAMMPQDVLQDMLEETVKYNSHGQHPLIEELGELERRLDGEDTTRAERREINTRIDQIEDELDATPSIVHDYIRNVFGDDGSSFAPTEPVIDAQRIEGVESVIKSMPDFMQHRVIETAVNEMNESGNMDGAHPYLKDLAKLYKQLDYDHLGSSRRESLNEQIADLETEILKNPKLLAEHAMGSADMQNVIADYVARSPEIDKFSGVTQDEFTRAFDHVKQNALSKVQVSFEDDHPMIKELSELYKERSEKSFYEWIDKPNLDARIDQIENELRQNPEIISDYMSKHTGDNLLSQLSPTQQRGLILPASLIQEGIEAGPMHRANFDGLNITPYTLGTPENYVEATNPKIEALPFTIDHAKFTLPPTSDINIDAISPNVMPVRLMPITDVEYPQGTPTLHRVHVQPEEHSYNMPNHESDALDTNPEYAEVAMAMERLKAGDPLDSVEQQRIEDIVNDPGSDPEIIAALKEQYGSALDQFENDITNDQSTVIAAEMDTRNDNNTLIRPT